jgi:sulfonate transport system substrate-binding protein
LQSGVIMLPILLSHFLNRYLRRRTKAMQMAALATMLSTSFACAQTSDTVRIGFQKSSTLIAVLKTNGELEKALRRSA